MCSDFLHDIFAHQFPLWTRNALRLIQQVDDRDLVADPLQLHFRQRQDEQQRHERPQPDGDQPPHIAQRRQGLETERPEDGQQQQQPQEFRAVEAKFQIPHNVCLPSDAVGSSSSRVSWPLQCYR